jgi:O-antigen/teichoic acid export membrane protein
MAGTVLAQTVALVSAPVLTRLYLPEHFGVVAVFISIVSVLSVISCLQYEIAVVLPKSEEKSQNLIAICLALNFKISLILMFIVPYVSEQVELWVQVKGIGAFLYLVPVVVFANGLERTFRHWFTRKKSFAFIAKMRVILPLSANGIKIAAGLLVGSSALWIIMGDIIGMFIVAAIFAIAFMKNYYQQFKNSITRREIWAVAQEYNKFPKYHSFTRFMNALSANLPAILFAFFFSFEFVGYYALARKILTKPIQLVSESVRSVFFQRAAEIRGKGGNPKSEFVKTTVALAAVSVVPFSIIMIWGEWIFSVIFGAEWAIAGFYAKLLSPWLFLMFINPPASQVILVEQKLFFLLILQILLLSFRSLAVLCGYYISPDPWVAVALLSSVGVIVNLILILYAYKLTIETESG